MLWKDCICLHTALATWKKMERIQTSGLVVGLEHALLAQARLLLCLPRNCPQEAGRLLSLLVSKHVARSVTNGEHRHTRSAFWSISLPSLIIEHTWQTPPRFAALPGATRLG